jgi:hypothetical protein
MVASIRGVKRRALQYLGRFTKSGVDLVFDAFGSAAERARLEEKRLVLSTRYFESRLPIDACIPSKSNSGIPILAA